MEKPIIHLKEISDLDIALDDQTNDETYLHILKEELPNLLHLSNLISYSIYVVLM